VADAQDRWLLVPAGLLAVAVGYLATSAPLLAVAIVAGAYLVLLVLRFAGALLLLLVAALPWEDMLAYPTPTVTVVKVLGLMLMIAYLLRLLVRREHLRLPPTAGLVLALAVVVLVSLLASPDPAAGLSKTLRYLLFIAFFFLVIQLVTTRDQLLRLLKVVALSASAAAVWGLLSFLTGGQLRAGGPIADPNDFAFVLMSVLPITIFFFVEEQRRWCLWGACAVLLVAATFATLSRGALLGLVALIVWVLLTRRLSLKAALAAALALIAAAAMALVIWGPLITERIEVKRHTAGENADARKSLWDAALLMTADHPLLGVGPDRYPVESPAYVRNNPVAIPDLVVHNSYLEVMVESGIFALIAFVGFLLATWRLLRRTYREAGAVDDRTVRRLVSAMQGALLVAIVSGSFLSQQLSTPFWLFGALATVVAGVASGGGIPGRDRLQPAAVHT
jgi:putative inorganic carbon (hco3(-)) transporter